MASTFRFPEDLKAEASAYAARLGVSLNALCAIALRDYLDSRKGAAQPAPSGPPDAGLPLPGRVVEAPKVAPAPSSSVPREVPAAGLAGALMEAVPVPQRKSKKRRKR